MTRALVLLVCTAALWTGCTADRRPVTDAGRDGGVMTDGGMRDGGPLPVDGGPRDAGPMIDSGPELDAGPVDAGPDADAGPVDAGPDADAGPVDSGPVDSGPVDSGPDAGPGCPERDLASMEGLSVATGTTVGAGADAEGSCGSDTAAAEDVAFRWTAPRDGTFAFDTIGSAFDTVVHVHMGGTCDGTELACNDDVPLGPEVTSVVRVDLTAGAVIVIVVDGYDDTESGDFVLSITEAPARETSCTGGVDEDRDGVADCDDPDCDGDLRCSETGATECGDTTDNDGDGDIDCADSECAPYSPCIEDGAECTDTMDNDGDGDTDCADSDCARTAPCDTCPDSDLMGTTGSSVVTGTNAALSDHRAAGCTYGSGGADAAFTFTATMAGLYTFDTEGSDYDTVLYVLEGACDGLEIACDDDGGTGSLSTLTVELAATETVVVVVDGYDDTETGTYVLNIARAAATFADPSAAGDLVITEIMPNPRDTDTGREWFEIHNPGTSALSLSSCVIRDGVGMHTVRANTIIRPGQYFVFAQSATPGGFTPSYSYGGAFTLNNTGMETVSIECGSGPTVIDTVVYDTSMGWRVVSEFSMSLDPGSTDATANDSVANWCVAPISGGPYDGDNAGTPGYENPSCP